ncbi:hypothetical protein A6V39_00990 [Candidatus Mycoplasma haematobovis]|uniref:Uncharacterized protein n=1 Tax=Candidatus Mycoplasma haematobovis TaxID=432608 RepID=A0A1A9QEG0_9MOLU|nr:hypothetical protein [Candidatus Mycoplasma haematobovis]OAL10628.1 hypothetical protein A6V39_00990 [Candidatus Mycoplasma haematobovis]
MINWGNTAYEFLKRYVSSLWSKDFWEKLRPLINEYGSKATEFLSLLSNIFKGGFENNESMLAQLFKALGQGNFGDFLSAVGQLASKQVEAFKGMTGQEFGDLMHAYNQNPEDTTKKLQEFAKKPEGTVKKDDVIGALKPSALIGKIKAAIARAEYFTAKQKLTKSDKTEEKKLMKNYKNYQRWLKKH